MLSIRYVTFEAEYIRYLLQKPPPNAEVPYMTVIGLEEWDLSSRKDRINAAVAVECMRSYLQEHAVAQLQAARAKKG
jgi:hypothetical protein